MRRTIILASCLIIIALGMLPNLLRADTLDAPVITLENATALVPTFHFDLDSKDIAWVEGEPVTGSGTPTPTPQFSDERTPPDLQISADGTRAAIISKSASRRRTRWS